MVVERCFHALDHERVRFHDPTGRCAVASAGAAALGIGVCILAAPEIVVGAVIITGAVVVAVALSEALDAYELSGAHSNEEETGLQGKPALRESLAERGPKPQPVGQDWMPPSPPEPTERERRADCTPRPARRLGGDDLHNTCADRVPLNQFPGSDVLVNGKNFDALQPATRTLWEVKTDEFDKQSPHSQNFFVKMKLPEIRRERRLAQECGYNFVLGVRSETHRKALLQAEPGLDVVVMDWC